MNLCDRKLADIIDAVQKEEQYQFSLQDVFDVGILTRRKLKLNGKCGDYMYLLFESELHDFVMRQRINSTWRDGVCVKSAIAARA